MRLSRMHFQECDRALEGKPAVVGRKQELIFMAQLWPVICREKEGVDFYPFRSQRIRERCRLWREWIAVADRYEDGRIGRCDVWRYRHLLNAWVFGIAGSKISPNDGPHEISEWTFEIQNRRIIRTAKQHESAKGGARHSWRDADALGISRVGDNESTLRDNLCAC